MVAQLLVSALTVGCIYALVALSFSLVYSATRVLNFAQGELAMVGALLGVTFFGHAGLPYPVAGVLTVLAAVALGAALSRLSIVPALQRQASLDALILITLGLALFLQSGSELAWGKNAVFVPAPLGAQPMAWAGVRIVPQSLLVVATTAVALGAVWLFYQRTRLGLAFQAVSINRAAAQLVGIDVNRVILVSFGLSAGLAALAGLMFSPLVSTSAYMGTPLSVKGFAAAPLGGLGNGPGAVVGGLIIAAVETFGAGYIATGYGDAFAFLVMLLVLFFRPHGLFGRPEPGLDVMPRA